MTIFFDTFITTLFPIIVTLGEQVSAHGRGQLTQLNLFFQQPPSFHFDIRLSPLSKFLGVSDCRKRNLMMNVDKNQYN